jgi:hypothetical protein
VPYRDSKLTHFLKDSLGGESKTMLIVQVSPCSEDALESHSSLLFGARAQTIEKGLIRANVIMHSATPTNEKGAPTRSKSRGAKKEEADE